MRQIFSQFAMDKIIMASSSGYSPIIKIKDEPGIEIFPEQKPREDLYEDNKIKDQIVGGPEVTQQTNIPGSTVTVDTSQKKTKTAKPKERCVCELCNKPFASYMGLQKHIKYACTKNSNKLSRQYKQDSCKLCNKVMVKKNLSYHMKFYCPMGDKKAKYRRKNLSCSECNKVYARPADLNHHITRVHSNIKPDKKFQCDHCGKKYLTKLTLISHMKAKHLNVTQGAVCNFCQKTFLYKANRDRHLKVGCPMITESTEQFICDVCNERYNKKVTLINHIRTLHTEYLECNYCNKKYASINSLESHVQTKHFTPTIKILDPRTWVCQLCKQVFKNKTNLNSHVLYSCPNNENKMKQKRFKCGFCTKDFYKASVLEKHKNICPLNPNRVETGKVGCLFCSKVFSNVRNSDLHMKYFCVLNRERIVRSYQCDSCEKSFKKKSSLLVHINNKHWFNF